jgi:L-lactate dehydrogenase complex protein LldF
VRRGTISRLPGPLAGWTAARDLKPVPLQSFRDWWREREGQPDRERQPDQGGPR